MNSCNCLVLAITKRFGLLVIAFCFGNTAIAQYNLVKNSSFEQYTVCPSTTNYQVNPMFWYQCTNQLGVYENACSPTLCGGVPYNCIKSKNYQPARTGNAYVYLDYVNGYTFQYLQSQLKDSLFSGHHYYVEFFVNLPNTMRFACNNHALLFTNNAVYVDTINSPYGLLPATPQIMSYGNPIVTDTFGWQKISGIHKAQGGEKFITIGNFKDDTLITLLEVNPTGYYGSGYIIDDVSVIPLDSFNLKADAGRDTTIHIGDSAFIGTLTNGIDSIKWQILNNNNTIDSIRPGFWVYPTVNTCYVVTQTVNGFTSSDTVCVNVLPLPLRFTNYELRITNERQIENHWITANEVNVSHFYIQRSLNGKDFVTIHKEQAKNKTYNEYSFIDNSPLSTVDSRPSTYYYRIVSVDKDGKTNYSEVRTINIQHQTSNIAIFPNPAKDVVNIECKEGIKEVRIVNQLGQTVIHQTINSIIHQLNMSFLPKGIYLLNIINKNNNIYKEKLIVQ